MFCSFLLFFFFFSFSGFLFFRPFALFALLPNCPFLVWFGFGFGCFFHVFSCFCFLLSHDRSITRFVWPISMPNRRVSKEGSRSAHEGAHENAFKKAVRVMTALVRFPPVLSACIFRPQVLETCCRPHMACGPWVLPSNQRRRSEAAGAGSTALSTKPGSGAAASAVAGDEAALATEGYGPTGAYASTAGGVGGRGGRGVGGDGAGEQRMVDDRLQRPVRKLVRERNGIRVLVGLLKYRRQAAAADSVRLRAALCLLGLAHDGQIAQVGLGDRSWVVRRLAVSGVVDEWVDETDVMLLGREGATPPPPLPPP